MINRCFGNQTVRATAVRWDAERNTVLAGDPKCLVYYVISKLNITNLAGDPKNSLVRSGFLLLQAKTGTGTSPDIFTLSKRPDCNR